MAFEAVIFDLDGTLLDTLEDLAGAMNAVLARNRLPVHGPEAYRDFVGDGMDMLVRRALPFEVSDEADLRRFVAEMQGEYARRWALTTRPYAGIPELLDALQAAGRPRSVLTNKPEEAARAILAAVLPQGGFHRVFGNVPGRPKKPDPAAALAVAAEMGIAANRILFIGDSAVDMQAATAAGMIPAGALWGFRSAEELRAAGAELLLASPVSLIRLL
jgi:phosphoglycolate phosphatase